MDFERLEVWQRSRQLCVSIYKYMKNLNDFGFKDQITRSGLSVPSNIAEGMERVSQKDKLHFLNIARSSCAELRTQIIIGRDIEYVPEKTADLWLKEAREISAMLSGLMNSIK